LKKMNSAREYADLALELGAAHSVPFRIEDVVFDPRTLLKCMYGCPDWGKGPTCPSRPGALKPWEFERILKEYRWGVIIHSHEKKIAQDLSYEIERRAFLDGFAFAFSMSDCACCKECVGLKGLPCADPKKARPAFHSVGIDVFSTVAKFDLPLYPLKTPEEEQNWYSAVFIE
jgi:predicted metal-binding protein